LFLVAVVEEEIVPLVVLVVQVVVEDKDHPIQLVLPQIPIKVFVEVITLVMVVVLAAVVPVVKVVMLHQKCLGVLDYSS
tara:strand:+ start:260 stop:496 length:237 start_codon:yes stop_codon:yes gene_type:complete